MSGKFCEKIFRREDFRPKIFFSARKKFFGNKKSASLEDALQIIKASRGLLNFGGLIFAISGAIGLSFFSVFCCELCVEKSRVPCEKNVHGLSQRSVPFLALLNATAKRSVPLLALLGAGVWWWCCWWSCGGGGGGASPRW